MIQKKIFIFFVACFMAGCAQTATKYKTNLGSRTAELASINEASSKISIGEITRNSAGIDMSCRLSTISFENGENVETYIKNALVEEFKSAGMYSQTSKKRLVGNIDHIHLDSFKSMELLIPMAQLFAKAKWHITMTFKGEGADPFSIPVIYEFPLRDGVFDFGDPCDYPSRQFSSAVANLITTMSRHPKFYKFLSK